jgi:hypothetical protein
LTCGSRQFFRPVSTSYTAVEVTGFSPIEYLTRRVSASRLGGADIESHFAHFRGLPRLLEVGWNRYVEDWVRVFFNTVWVGQERYVIWFMCDESSASRDYWSGLG